MREMPHPLTRPRSVAVIGGGLAGLASAARLAHGGAAVTVFERNPRAGGKVASKTEAGFRWDLGPSLLTMPHILNELWAECGDPAGPPLELVRLESACRYRWTDGTVIDEDAAFWSRPDAARLLAHARGIYEISEETFLMEAPDRLWRQFRPRTFARLRHLPKLAWPQTIAADVARRFRDPHVAQIFLRFATYNGSSPYRTPAAFQIIPFVEAEFGAWYIRGGMEQLPAAIETLARSRGASIECGVTVDAVARDCGGFRLSADRDDLGRFDAVVCNRDAVAAGADLLPEGYRRKPHPRRDPSTSGFVMLLGVRGITGSLGHHNILFSDDYPREFADLFDRRIPPGQPTVYIAISARTDPDRAPAGDENWFVLVNAPADHPGFDWAREGEAYAERVLDRIEAFGLRGLRDRIACRSLFTPADFERRDLSWRGALYGYASHGPLSAFHRPPVAVPGLPGFTFAGGATHPGGGIPLVLRSARIASERTRRHLASLP
jgi:phytoene desaturase